MPAVRTSWAAERRVWCVIEMNEVYRVCFLQSLPRLAIACKRKMLHRAEIDFLRLNRAKKRLLQHYLHIFIFSLFFFEIFVKILMNLPLFVQNVDFFKQLS